VRRHRFLADAYEADVNRTYLSKLEKGVSYPGVEIIAKLANALGVEPAELLMRPEKSDNRTR
jgi:transcriptional regulator with XRE-family HTH domain